MFTEFCVECAEQWERRQRGVEAATRGSALRSSELTRRQTWKLLSLAVVDIKLPGVMERTVTEEFPECLGNAGSRLAMLCRGGDLKRW